MPRPALILLTALALLAAAPPATASAARAPKGFYGVSVDGAISRLPAARQDEHWDLMARSGVESARVVFSWAAAQPFRSRPPSFADFDRLVSRAALRRVRLLPVVFDAPRWAQLEPGRRHSPPARPGEYGTFLRALVARYGRGGSFWREHPEVPRLPVGEWQAWNEPHLRFYWNAGARSRMSWPRGYVKLLKAARRAVKGRDRRAKVVLAGLSERPWHQLRRLYRLRARRYFDVAAVHPYTGATKEVLLTVRLTRSTMRRYRDGRKPLWVTELGWPAARGRLRVDAGLRRLTTTETGMARRLRSTYAAVLKRRRNRRYNAGRLYWFTWASSYQRGEGGIWEYAGLVLTNPVSLLPTPALNAYRDSARRHQGCAKNSRGRCR